MNNKRIALYIGNSLYPQGNSQIPETIKTLHNSPLTSPILSLLNQSATNPEQLVFNDSSNPVFDISGDYIGSLEWSKTLLDLRGGNVQEIYISFSTSGCEFMNNLIKSNPSAAQKILSFIKNTLGFDGIDLDYEARDYSASSPIYTIVPVATQVGLKVTAAPYGSKTEWSNWVHYVQINGGTVSWLNLQCYAGGKSINPGDWLDLSVPIVAGSCNNCALPQTTCSPQDVENLFKIWTTGGSYSVPEACWTGSPNHSPQDIGGGFIWVYSSIKDQYFEYMTALQKGLGV